MSGPFAALISQVSRLRQRRNDSHSRAIVRALPDPRDFSGFTHVPPPRGSSDFGAARAALAGTLCLCGHRFALTGQTPWDIALPAPVFDAHLHRFDWLGDFGALASRAARGRARLWVLGWIDRFGNGSGPGWRPDVAATRLMHLITHMPFLEKDLAPEGATALQASLVRHLDYVLACWQDEAVPDRRVIALAAILQAAACMRGFDDHILKIERQLEEQCDDHFATAGTVTSRNPEALLTLFDMLVWTRATLDEMHLPVGTAHKKAIAAMAPTLRTLRHPDGTLARFHGGSGGGEGRLDHALFESGVRTQPGPDTRMGYMRLGGGRLVAILDCARPPTGTDALTAHAGTLAFELSSGRRRVVVNCGPGATFGEDWRRFPRTTAAHNTLALDKTSSSQLASRQAVRHGEGVPLVTRPSMVTVSRAQDATGVWIQARHDGYLADYGLLHERRFFVGTNGHQVHGEDVLLAPDVRAERRFAARLKASGRAGIPLAVHFHLHPDVRATIAHGPDAVTLRLASGEVWVFRAVGGQVELETSAYLDPARADPVPTRQIIVRSEAVTHNATLNWNFVREGADHAPTPRDLVRDLVIDAPPD